MSKARERQQNRRHTQEMVKRAGKTNRQIASETDFKLPEIRIPGLRWLLLIPAAAILFGIVILGLSFINPPETTAPPNAIWLDSSWTYQERTAEELGNLTINLRDHEIGSIFIYVSSLRPDNTWSGLPTGQNRFTEVEERIQQLATQFRAVYPSVRLYAWIEISANTPEGYRLDSLQVQNTVATFSGRMITRLGFDGVLLDVKPIFEENDDFPVLLRSVRAAIGLQTPLIVAVPPDLTPTGTRLNLPAVIAPGTQWSMQYKQRIALQADQIVVMAFNSYHTNPVDYIEWVTYQADSYIEAMSQMDTLATLLISVPNYAERLPAHDPNIESLSGGLDGVQRSRLGLDETTSRYLAGIAIFTDQDLTSDQWRLIKDKWIRG